jgi:hypothetical protein
MRSTVSSVSALTDWQAANLAIGLGRGARVPKGATDPQRAVGRYVYAADVDALACSTVLRPFVELLREHPAATHVNVVQRFYDGGDPKSGVATLVIPDSEALEIGHDRWPSAVAEDDWSAISVEDSKIFFTLYRSDVDAFTIGDVVCWTPLAEIVLTEHKNGCVPMQAAAHVRSAYSEDRVAQGRAPQRWGAPGLHLIDAYLDCGGNPSAFDAAGSTALATAIYLQAGDVVRKLVNAGADINAPVAGGLYPIDVAVLAGQLTMVRLCGELGASPNTPGYLQPSLRAVEMRSPEMLSELLKMGAALDAETPDGLTISDSIFALGDSEQLRFRAAITQAQIESSLAAPERDLIAGPARSVRGMSL